MKWVTSTKIVAADEKNWYGVVMLSPEQSRAARGWLDWSQEELAKRAKVSLSTVRDFEKGRRTPIPNNIEAIQRALEVAGIRLAVGPNGESVGITYSGAPL